MHHSRITQNRNYDAQAEVNRHFQFSASYWRDVYAQSDISALIYQQRRAAILEIVDDCALTPGADVLEIGCGGGSTSVALARKGLRLAAVDSVEEMLRITLDSANKEGVAGLMTVERADAARLPFANASFDVVIAAGVTPWLPSLAEPLAEMFRVLRPGGRLIITADNRIALSRLLDPVARILEAGGAVLHAMGLRSRGVTVRMYSPWRFNRLIRHAELELLSGRSIGFGPFSIAKKPLLANWRAVRVHTALQRYADSGGRVMRFLGRQYIVTARKL